MLIMMITSLILKECGSSGQAGHPPDALGREHLGSEVGLCQGEPLV